jgi:hypothetical protein
MSDNLREIYENMLSEKSKVQLVDWNIAGYDKKELIGYIMDGFDRLADKRNLPPIDSSSVNDILSKLRFKKEE